MPTLTVPNSHGTDFVEFNRCHAPGGRPDGGQFCSAPEKGGGGGWKQTGKKVSAQPSLPGMAPKAISGDEAITQAKTPIKVGNLSRAVALILKGHVVELTDVKSANTVIRKLADIALQAKAKGQKAPYYDLCHVTVPGTNLFCGQAIKTKEFPDGVPRIRMPQLGGKPRPGSDADKLPKDKDGNVDGSEQFIEWLGRKGIRAKSYEIPASRLKASQSQLRGPVVAGMMRSSELPSDHPKHYNPAKGRIFISNDFYVIDGHHRWAAVVGNDARDGRLGQDRMKTVRVRLPMTAILHLANEWAREFGIEPSGTD